jgi:hypothetical protein
MAKKERLGKRLSAHGRQELSRGASRRSPRPLAQVAQRLSCLSQTWLLAPRNL